MLVFMSEYLNSIMPKDDIDFFIASVERVVGECASRVGAPPEPHRLRRGLERQQPQRPVVVFPRMVLPRKDW